MEIISKNKKALVLMMFICNASLLQAMESEIRAIESEKIVVRIEIQPTERYLNLLQQLLVTLQEAQRCLSSTNEFTKIRSHLIDESFHLNRTQIQQPDTKNELLQSQDFETIWIKSLAQLVMAQLPCFEDPNDFEILINRGRELLEQDKVAVVLDGNSSKLPFPIVSYLWPQVIVQAIYEKCKIANYTKLIIASELSASEKLEKWIAQYIKSDEGKKELNREVDDLTPLISAAARGSLGTARLLLEAGAGPNVSNDCGDRPIMFAACRNRVDMIELLCEFGAYVNAENDEGFTSIHLAVSHNRKEAIECLLEKKAHLCLRARNGRAPLDTAIVKNNSELVVFLLSRGSIIHTDGKNSELVFALKELSKIKAWRNKDLDREKRAESVIIVLLEHEKSVINENVIQFARELNLTDVANVMQLKMSVK